MVNETLFWQKVKTTSGDECWEWQAGKIAGYGRFRVGRKLVLAHRLAWILLFGDIPPNMEILHKCDNPSCVRPGHLYCGTKQENARDKEIRGRGNHLSSLTPQQKAEVVEYSKTHKQYGRTKHLAFIYGVDESTIRRVLYGDRRVKHLSPPDHLW